MPFTKKANDTLNTLINYVCSTKPDTNIFIISEIFRFVKTYGAILKEKCRRLDELNAELNMDKKENELVEEDVGEVEVTNPPVHDKRDGR